MGELRYELLGALLSDELLYELLSKLPLEEHLLSSSASSSRSLLACLPARHLALSPCLSHSGLYRARLPAVCPLALPFDLEQALGCSPTRP